MAIYFSLLIFSFILTSITIVPFINFLYRIKFRRQPQKTRDFQGSRTPVFDRFHSWKAGTPVGGGILVILVVSLMFLLLFPFIKHMGLYITAAFPIPKETLVIFFTFISFGLLGLYDDLYKFFATQKTGFFGLRLRYKLAIQCGLGLIVGLLLFRSLGIDILYIPFFGLILNLGWLYVPLAALIIVGFANAFNITDGLDGLSSGLLMICLFAFWAISSSTLDTTTSVFIALWIGSLLAFLYFNVFPARIWLGDVGALSFGATLAVVSLLLGKIIALLIIGGIFIAEAASSLLQILSKKFRHRKLFPVAPLHLWLQKYGWDEPKIVMRAWLAGILLAVFGLWLAVI
jgi:phospho-N-acetylmuramoyl-pentapeptide-transferase